MMNNKTLRTFLPPLIAAVVLVGAGMLSTIIPWLSTPPDRVFTGMNGYSNDYIQYVSYIKEGMYGRYTMLFRSFPFLQPATPIHFFYIATGFIANLMGLPAPLAFHLTRIVLGSFYVFLTYQLFSRVFKRTTAFLGTFLAFFSTPLGWPHMVQGTWEVARVSFFNFSIIHPERVTDRPHYVFGAIMFLWILILLIKRDSGSIRRSVVLFLLSFLATMVHTSVGILLLILSALRLSKSTFFGSALALGITYYFVMQYTLVPEIWLDSYIYSGPMTASGIIKDLISFGPTLLFGMIGLAWSIFKKDTHKTVHGMVAVWLVVQIGLFLYGYRFFHADRVRFLQSLYFIPMAYGTILFFEMLSKRMGKRIVPLGIISMILISLPLYTQDLTGSIYSLTDYKAFSTFVFPTKGQADSYHYLDRETPKESIVLAAYEAANNLLIYSHNMVIGNDQGWGRVQGQKMVAARDTFFGGSLSEEKARRYLYDNHIRYIYYGYQERSYGGDIRRYTFLTPEFSNKEVTIYRVQ